jgi:hypothetical protein
MMPNRPHLVLFCLAGLAAASAPAATPKAVPADAGYPRVILTNGILDVLAYLPDPTNAYYRGRRFDWSGMVGQVIRNGHTYLGELKQPHKPEIQDHGVGLAEEFGIEAPLGYAEARPGETFVKIGVGVLRRDSTNNYFFGRAYPVVQMPSWKVTHGPDWVCFEQDLTGDRNWGYHYTKRIELLPGRPELTIRRILRNTGAKAITTDHYSHNMFVFDGYPIGIDYRIRFPFAPGGIATNGKARLDGNELTVVTPPPNRSYWTKVTGFDAHTTNCFRLQHAILNTAVDVITDLPISRLTVYAEATALCPESFVCLSIPPGEEHAWSTSLRFE